jgi:hypothetical protein
MRFLEKDPRSLRLCTSTPGYRVGVGVRLGRTVGEIRGVALGRKVAVGVDEMVGDGVNVAVGFRMALMV